MASRPPSATTRKVGKTTGTLAGRKPADSTLKDEDDDLVLKFDVQGEIEEFQFDV